MPNVDTVARFERRGEFTAESPTLIVGMPENGVVGSIAVNQITDQLELEHIGNVIADSFPTVSTYSGGRVRDLVRVYAGGDPAVVVPQCDIALPMSANADLATCIVDDLAEEFERVIVLAGFPAQTEEQLGDVSGIVTDSETERELRNAGIQLESGVGYLAGASGSIVNECYHANISTMVLIVKAHPFLPDPESAQTVIEEALEPLVDFEISTRELEEQADEIKREMEQVSQHFEQLQTGRDGTADSSMFQ